MKKIYLLILILFTTLSLAAQQDHSELKKDAFQIISKKDSSGGQIHVYQDKKIEKLVNENTGISGSNINGFRIQVYSSNEHKTARENAFNLERKLEEVFPETPVYVNYSSPFWKVRVGDFKTQAEARDFAEEIFRVFPKLRNESYTVRDKINTPGSK